MEFFSRSIAVFFYHHNDNKWFNFHYYHENTGLYLSMARCLLAVEENFRYFYFIDTVQNGFTIANAIYLSIYAWFYFNDQDEGL